MCAGQGLLKLLWMVYSEGKLQPCLKLRICTCCRISEAKFYLHNSTKIAKARPGFDDPPEHPSVQINSSSPWLGVLTKVLQILAATQCDRLLYWFDPNYLECPSVKPSSIICNSWSCMIKWIIEKFEWKFPEPIKANRERFWSTLENESRMK